MTPLSNTTKVILFDHDDTLVGTIGAKWAQHKYIARRYYRKKLTDAEIRQHWGVPLRELVCHLYSTDDAEQALAYNVTHHEAFPKTLLPSTIPTLQQLVAAGLHAGVVTATVRYSLDHDIALHNIPRDALAYIQTSEDTPHHKPDPKVFTPALQWLAQQNIAPHEVTYVGDSLHDFAAAHGAGLNFLGVTTGLTSSQQFADAGATSVPDTSYIFKNAT